MTFIIAPGATPINDLSDLKIPISTQSELDAAEFDNIHRAEQIYFKRRKMSGASWFTPTFLQQIHKTMFDDVWEWAGKYRKQVVLPVGIDPYKIPSAIYELSQDVAYWVGTASGMPYLEMSARIHHRLTWIHPFPNGNGRFSRFVSNLFLFSFRQPLPTWPGELERDGSPRRQYLKALQEADQGHLQPLVDYLKFLGAK